MNRVDWPVLTIVCAVCVFTGPLLATGQQISEEEVASQLSDLVTQSNFVFTGTITSCKDAGKHKAVDGKPVQQFFRPTFTYNEELLGSLRDRVRAQLEADGRKLPSEFTVSALYPVSGDRPAHLVSGQRCVVFVKTIRAGAMAGTVPMSIVRVEPYSELLVTQMRQLATDHKADQ